ncbi:MAG TPA: dipeptidase [Bacteroidales bacterium]|jgi:acetylornithine deacetylase/succinyl-diaminopimelate desuccinylase-like protein|nr:dipeptidase [Bacteroidales bacterium]OQC60415.1 MAG: Succinyl-diaminopimelate desuccinylase [Bacteroidetes bacterium ADurb.Bin012]MBP9588558.1 dipeptidase [Bacteroidales bacterium]HNQ60314.1 dipeptidase [Bacteroidales bacterium]HNU21997.1 dipeptidase [Bacteroidales bacterium]
MEDITTYLEKNSNRIMEELFGLLKIPSISSLSEHKDDMYRAAEYYKNALLKAGMDKVEIFDTPGHPVVYAEKILSPDFPTVLVYAHADVMPVDPIELWQSPPFEPEIREGKIYARGADDDKGQGFMHVKAIEYLVNSRQLQCNVKFMIEGEEEIGSPHLEDFCQEHKDMLKADIILLSDTSMIAPDTPSITVGLRGLAYIEVEVAGPNRDLHSGLYGGIVHNPIHVLSRMIGNLHDDHGRIIIPGFYDDVRELSEEERIEFNLAPFDEESYKKSLGINCLWGESGFTPLERIGIRPSLDVCGIWGGYTGEGSKTILPSKASAKVSMRLVPDQDPKKIANLFENYLHEMVPNTVKLKVTALHGGYPYLAPTNIPAYKAAQKAYLKTFGKYPIPTCSGGSIPIISTFDRVLGIKSLLLGFGLESDAIHSPNENFSVKNFFKGIETISEFYIQFAHITKD